MSQNKSQKKKDKDKDKDKQNGKSRSNSQLNDTPNRLNDCCNQLPFIKRYAKKKGGLLQSPTDDDLTTVTTNHLQSTILESKIDELSDKLCSVSKQSIAISDQQPLTVSQQLIGEQQLITGCGYLGESPAFEIKKWGYKGQLLPSYYFQPHPGVDSNQLRMTNISVYSTTPWKEANFISRTINNFYSSQTEDTQTPVQQVTGPISIKDIGNQGPRGPLLKPINNSGLILTDATANIGGNTISFYLNGIHQVNAVEIDPLTCEILKHNLHIYQLPTQTIYCQDYVDIYQLLEQDIVFLDPPWGGPNYKNSSVIDLYLGGGSPFNQQSQSNKEKGKSGSTGELCAKNIIEICAELMEQKKATLIVLKLPINYNLPGLIARMPNKNFMTHKIYRKKHHSYNIVFCW